MSKWILAAASTLLLFSGANVAQDQDLEPAQGIDLSAMPWDRLAQRAYELNLKGDFEGARDAAFEMFIRDNTEPGAALLVAYALRGQGEHHGSIAYSTLALRGRAFDDENRWQRHDGYIGRAASYVALGEFNAALSDLIEAEKQCNYWLSDYLTKPLPYYQLACICSIQSEVRRLEARTEEADIERAQAVAYLVIARKHGYDQWEHARADLDLKPLHGYEPFEQLFK